MKLTLRGKEYECDLLSLLTPNIGPARVIKRETGMTIADLRDGLVSLDREDPDVLAALVYLVQSRAGETVDWADIDSLSYQEIAAGISFDNTDISGASSENTPLPVGESTSGVEDSTPDAT